MSLFRLGFAPVGRGLRWSPPGSGFSLSSPALWPLLLSLVWLAGCSPSSSVSRSLGAACTTHDQCDEMCLTGEEFPDGFCSLLCDSDKQCADDSACVDIDPGMCLMRCSGADDCAFLGPRWTCVDRPHRSNQGDVGLEVEVKVCMAE